MTTNCAPPADELATRPAGEWTQDKLAIISAYLPAFGTACKKAKAWFYVDGFAGPGVNVVNGTGERVCGSPLIALGTEPRFSKCLLMDDSPKAVDALTARVANHGDRADVRRGDVNKDLLPMMREVVNRRAPTLCLLDPEGFELDWATIADLAGFGQSRLTELLILFQVNGLHRVLGLADEKDWAAEMATRFFGDQRWDPVLRKKRAGELTVDAARNEFLTLYADGLRALGYEVLTRDILAFSTTGHLKYVLVFASGNQAGINIMDHCFKTTYTGGQGQLFPPAPRPV